MCEYSYISLSIIKAWLHIVFLCIDLFFIICNLNCKILFAHYRNDKKLLNVTSRSHNVMPRTSQEVTHPITRAPLIAEFLWDSLCS